MPKSTFDSTTWNELSGTLHHQKTVIILHGTSAAGKSSLSRRLAEKLQMTSYDHDNFMGVLNEKQSFREMAAQILHDNKACILDTNTLKDDCLSTMCGFSNHLVILVYSPLKLLVERFFERRSSHMNPLGYIFKGFRTLYTPISSSEICIGGRRVPTNEIAVGKLHISEIEWIESQIKGDAPLYLKKQWTELKVHFRFEPGVQELFLFPKLRRFAVVSTEQDIESFLEDVRHVLQKFIEPY